MKIFIDMRSEAKGNAKGSPVGLRKNIFVGTQIRPKELRTVELINM